MVDRVEKQIQILDQEYTDAFRLEFEGEPMNPYAKEFIRSLRTLRKRLRKAAKKLSKAHGENWFSFLG